MRQYLLLIACLLHIQWTAAQMKAYKQADGVSIQATFVLTVNTAVTATDVLTGDGECAMPDISEERFKQLPWYGNEAFLDNFYDSLQRADPVSEPSPASRTTAVEVPRYRVPIRFWVYRNANVPPGGRDGGVELLPTERNFQLMMDALNEAFRNNGISVRFYMRCVSYIDEPAAVNLGGYFEQADLAFRNNDNAVINVHIVDQMRSGGIFHPLYDAIFIPRRVYTNNDRARTLPHEIGHYLSLLHTHFGYRFPCLWEPVRRGFYPNCPQHSFVPNTCSVTGDGFCDTPGDPDQSGQAVGCVYNGGERDYLNELYDPAEDNYMAYAPRECRSWFSNKQGKAMMWSLAWQRAPQRARGNWGTDGSNNFDSFEPDNGDRAARNIPLNGLQRHSFHSRACTDSEDWVRFRVPAGGFLGAYFLEATGVNGAAHPVTSLELFPEIGGGEVDGFVAGARINAPFTTPDGRARLEIPCQSVVPGRWYLVRISNGGTQFGQYDVTLTNGPATGQAVLPTISGPAIVCSTANAAFTLDNAPAGATVSWAASANLTPQSGTGTNAAVRALAGASGQGWVEFTITGNCGTTVRENLQVGVIPSDQVRIYTRSGSTPVTSPIRAAPGTTHYFEAPYFANVSYRWQVVSPSPAYTIGSDSRFLDFQMFDSPNKVVTILLSVINACGTGGSYSVSLTNQTSSYTLYPNPADSYVEVAPDETLPDNQAAGQDFQVVVYDNFAQEKLRTKTKPEDNLKKLRLDVKQLPRGIYVVQIIYAGGVEQKQLEIMR